MDLAGTSSIITGGASGIGAAIARAIAEQGAHCVVLDLNDELGNAIAGEVGGQYVRADVTEEGAVQEAVNAATEAGPLRSLVNSAGIGAAGRTVDHGGTPLPLESFERILRINLIGTFNCLRLAAAAMVATAPVGTDGARGAIVNIASVAAFDGQIGQAAYSASKAGIVGMTLTIARDLAAHGIRVNTVAPGLTDTPGFAGLGAELVAELSNDVLFPRRLGKPDELAAVVLACLVNDYMNGETVRVDGGARLAGR